jgi:hypothetical protein
MISPGGGSINERCRERGPLAGLELEFVGDRLKKGFKRRDAFKGGIATLGALAVATGVGRHVTAAQGLARSGLLPEIFPRRSTQRNVRSWRWARRGSRMAWNCQDSSVTCWASRSPRSKRQFSVEQQLQIYSRSRRRISISWRSIRFQFGALIDAANQIIAKGSR